MPIAYRRVDTGHGRREVRTIQVTDAPADLGLPHAAQVFLIERYTTAPRCIKWVWSGVAG